MARDMTPTAAVAQTSPGLSGRMKVLLALILTGQFMAILDASIVNVAIPTIRHDLGASGSDLQLIVAGYVIAYAVLLITGARLGMRFGFRTAFLSGLTLFTAASLAWRTACCRWATICRSQVACRLKSMASGESSSGRKSA